jgi:hypothetical protein
MSYSFEKVEGDDTQISVLYDLISKRSHKISHADLPSYDEHSKFVLNHPYLCWYLIRSSTDYVGSFYIKADNSIGFNVQKPDKELVRLCLQFVKKHFIPQPEEPSVVPNYFYLNVAASNLELIDIMNDLKVPKIQLSFKLE